MGMFPAAVLAKKAVEGPLKRGLRVDNSVDNRGQSWTIVDRRGQNVDTYERFEYLRNVGKTTSVVSILDHHQPQHVCKTFAIIFVRELPR